MKGFIRRGGVLLAACSMLLTGCGESMLNVNADEENIIVAYSSGVIAKANKKQPKGMTYVRPSDAAEAEGPTKDTQDPGTDGTGGSTAGSDQASQDQQGTGSKTDPAQKPSAAGGETQAKTVTLTESVGIQGITADYKGHEVNTAYVQGGYFAMDAKSGSTYIIVNIALSNQTGQAAACDILSKSLTSKLVVNQEDAVSSMTTILPNDFSTYSDTIQAGSSVDTVLIFQVKEESASDIKSLGLQLGVNGNVYNIPLE